MRIEKWIVVEDMTGEFWEGSLVDENLKRKLTGRRMAMLPVMPSLFTASGVGGFHKRSWGSGWPLDAASPKFFSPLTIFCTRDLNSMHWAAKLVLSPAGRARLEANADTALIGSLQLAPDSGQHNANRIGLAPKGDGSASFIAARSLKLADMNDDDSSFYVGGEMVVSVPTNGHYGVALYGHMPDVRVAWAAVSQVGT